MPKFQSRRAVRYWSRRVKYLALLATIGLPAAVFGETTTEHLDFPSSLYVPKGQHFLLVEISQLWKYLDPGNECAYVKQYGSGDVCAYKVHAYLNVPGGPQIAIDLDNPGQTTHPPADFQVAATDVCTDRFHWNAPQFSDTCTYATKNEVRVIDVSQLTVNDGITVTYGTNITYAETSAVPSTCWSLDTCYNDYWAPSVYVDFAVLAPSFTLTQTSKAFRPQDARDGFPATPCAVGDVNNCYPEFTAALDWNNGEGSTRAFDDTINPTFRFKLEHTTKQATWLPGKSTNYGEDADTAADYVFEAAKNGGIAPSGDGLQIAGIAGTTPSASSQANVTVTSHDYGGSANLRAYVTLSSSPNSGLPPVEIEVQTIVEYDGEGWEQEVVPPACAGTGAFASLPVDQDCNGIADSWEDQNEVPNQPPPTDAGGKIIRAAQGEAVHWPIDLDEEAGYLPTSPKGDGWSVFDEYRGFHYVADDGTTVKWVSTDPATKFDIFFWDAGFIPPLDGLGHNLPANPNLYTQALREMLCLQGDPMEMGYGATFPAVPAFPAIAPVPPVPTGPNVAAPYCAAGDNELIPYAGPNPLRYLYRRVNAEQAQVLDPSDVQTGVRWFNINSLTSFATQGNHTVLVYNSHSIPEHNPGQIPIGITYNYLTGVPARSARIDFNYPAIDLGARQARILTPATHLAQTLAHETGHWFGQRHPTRIVTYDGSRTSVDLPWPSYTFPNNTLSFSPTILVGLQMTTEPTLPVGQPSCQPLQLPPCPVRIRQSYWAEHVAFPGAELGTYQTRNSAGVTVAQVPFQATKAGKVSYQVETMQNEIMDWRANSLMFIPAFWHFDVANLYAFCGKNPCQQGEL